MIYESRDAVHRHRSHRCIVYDGVHDKLRFVVHGQSSLNFGVSFLHPCLAQARNFIVVVAVVPTVQRPRCIRTELAADAVWLHSVFCPSFLVTKSLFVSALTSEIQLFLQNGLLSQVCKDRIIEIQID